MQGMEYNHKVDIFSLGLIYLEILCEFSTQSERRITLHSVKEKIYPNKLVENYPVELALIKRMTCSNPNVRPDSKDILLSQEFSSLCKLYEFV